MNRLEKVNGKRAARTVYRITPCGKGRAAMWALFLSGITVPKLYATNKKVLVTAAQLYVRWIHETRGVDTQLVIHGRNGKIQTEYTYGHDPEKYKG